MDDDDDIIIDAVILRVKLITCYAILKRWIRFYGLNFSRPTALVCMFVTNRRIEDLCVALWLYGGCLSAHTNIYYIRLVTVCQFLMKFVGDRLTL
jgi:hypothetical protein